KPLLRSNISCGGDQLAPASSEIDMYGRVGLAGVNRLYERRHMAYIRRGLAGSMATWASKLTSMSIPGSVALVAGSMGTVRQERPPSPERPIRTLRLPPLSGELAWKTS